jgi:hypothetical protein
MAVIKCHVCKKEFTATSVKCPGCGTKPPENAELVEPDMRYIEAKSNAVLVFAGLIVLMLLAFIGLALYTYFKAPGH